MILQTRPTRVFEDYFKIIHLIDLNDYKDNIEIIQTNIANLKNATSTDLGRAINVLETKFSRLEKLFEIIYPRNNRVKRGLANVLGTTIKFITGNMDSEDANEIERRIMEITLNNKQLITAHNEQITINDKLISHVKNMTETINNQQIVISTTLNNLNNKQNNFFSNLITISQIDHDICLLSELLDDLIECVRMAKLRVVAKNIMSIDEMRFIENFLKSKDVDVYSYEQIYEHLEMQAYYSDVKLIFLIKIPNFMPAKFTEFIVEPVPNINQTIIVTKDNAIISSGREIFANLERCIEISNAKFCNLYDLKNISNDKCISNILRGIDATCDSTAASKDLVIKEIYNNTLIIKNAVKLELSSMCGINRTLTGNFIVKFDQCSIVLNGIVYKKPTQIKHKISSFSIHGIHIKTELKNTISLSTIENANIVNSGKIKEIIVSQHTNDSMQYAFHAITIIAIILVISFVTFKSRKTQLIVNATPLPASQGGGVTAPQTPFA